MNDEKLQKLFALASNNANLNEASVAALKFVKALQKSGKPIRNVADNAYDKGKKWGYEEGFNEGKLQQKTAYNNGYSNGYSVGKSEGYNIGLQKNINKQHINNNNNIVYPNQTATATVRVDTNNTGRITFNGN